MQSTDEVSEATEHKGISCWGLLVVHATWIILLGIGVWYGNTSWQFVTEGKQVPATVVRLAESYADNSVSYSPVFTYQVDERTYIYESVNSSNPSAYAVGDQTTLLVLPADPARARENSFSELWLLPIAMGLGAVFGLGIAIYVPIAISRRRTKTILPVHIQ